MSGYSPATPNYSYNTINPYDVPQVEPSEYYAQAQQKAAHHNAQKAYDQQTFSKLEKSSEGMNLCNEAHEVQTLVNISRDLAVRLRDFLFDSVPECGEAGCCSTAQVPSLEGNIRSAKYMLKDHVRELENILTKIGGR